MREDRASERRTDEDTTVARRRDATRRRTNKMRKQGDGRGTDRLKPRIDMEREA